MYLQSLSRIHTVEVSGLIMTGVLDPFPRRLRKREKDSVPSISPSSTIDTSKHWMWVLLSSVISISVMSSANISS